MKTVNMNPARKGSLVLTAKSTLEKVYSTYNEKMNRTEIPVKIITGYNIYLFELA